MFSLFQSLQFAQPALLFLAAGIPLLVFAYLKRTPQRSRRVSSVMIFEKLSKHPSLQRRIKLPLRFLFELLLLILLAIAAAQPFFKNQHSNVAVLIDNSLSMAALSSDLLNGETRFVLAQNTLLKWLDEQDSENRYTLFTSSSSLERHSDFAISAKELPVLLKSLTTTLAADSLASHVNELSLSGNYDQVVVVTDRTGNAESDSKSAFGSLNSTNVKTITVGSRAENVYLSSVRFDKGTDRNSSQKIVAAIGTSGSTSREISAKLYGESLNKNTTAPTALLSTTTTVNPEQPTELVFPLPEAAQNFQVFRVEIALRNSSADNAFDSLAQDNVAWVAKSSAGNTLPVLLVTPQEKDASALGLGAIPNFNVTEILPTGYAELDEAAIKQFSLIIFHRSAPSEVPAVPTLLILPPENNPLFPATKEVLSPQISSWAQDSPLTQYLRLPLLKPQRAVIFNTPIWAQAVINVEAGPILLSGESRGVRFAGVGIELLPFEGARTPTLSILSLNLFNWLSSSSDISGASLTGSVYRLDSSKRWTVSTPKGDLKTLSSEKGELLGMPLSDPGLYLLRGVDPQNEKSKVIKLLTVNATHHQESNTFETNSYSYRRRDADQTSPGNALADNSYWPTLLQIVIGLLLCEALFAALQKRKEA